MALDEEGKTELPEERDMTASATHYVADSARDSWIGKFAHQLKRSARLTTMKRSIGDGDKVEKPDLWS